MSLALVTAFLLVAPPAQAQSDYPGGGSGGGNSYPGSGGGSSPPPSHCWNITYSQTGTWSEITIDNYGNRTPLNGEWDTLTAPYNTSGGGDNHGYHYVSDITDGTVTATLTWVPADGYTQVTDPPPSKVYINEYADARWNAVWDTNNSSPPFNADYTGALADDGLGDPAVDGESTGHHLIQKDGSSGTITVSCKLHAHSPTSVNLTSGYPGGGYPGGGYPGGGGAYWSWSGGALIVTNFSVSVDTRAVTISCPDVDGPNDSTPTFYKNPDVYGRVDANGDPLVTRVAHQREPDGTMRADIGLDYGDNDYQNQSNYVNVTFTANPTGDWAENLSQYLWNTSLKNASYPGTLNGVPPDPGIQTLLNVYRRPFVIDNGQTPPTVYTADVGDISGNASVDHLFFKYQNGDNRPDPWTPYETGNDGDGAIATADYYLSLHQPHEFLPSVKHGLLEPGEAQENIIYQDAVLDIKSQPPYAAPGDGVQCEWNAPSPLWADADQILSILSHAPWPNEWVGLGFAAAGGAATDYGPKADSATINFDDNTWNDPASQFPQDYPKDQYPMADYQMAPGKHLRYFRHYVLKDDYDQKGFEGETLVWFDTYAGKGPSFGTFTWAPTQ